MSQLDEPSMTFHASESAIRALFEHSADAMLLMDDGLFVDCNPAATRLMKCTREELLNMPPERLSPERQPDGQLSSEKAAQLISIAYEQGSNLFEWAHCRPNGEEFSVEVSLTAVPFDNRRVLFTVWRDITSRKKMEADLREREESYRSLFNSLQDGMFVIQDGIVVLVNSTLESLTGYREDELVGEPFTKVIAPEDKAVVVENYRRRQAGESLLDEYLIHILKQDGQTRVPVNLRAMVITYNGRVATMGSLRNISEKMHMEAERAQALASLQDMVTRRSSQVRLSNEIAQQIAAAPALDDLFNRVVTLVKERLGYYHTQLLRHEPALGAVVLVKGYGEVGEKMLAAGHRMEMGRGLIGSAAATGQTVMRSDVVNAPDWRPNPLLPETKGEIAVPVKYGEQILGVLDVQSDQANVLTDDDRLLLEGLCGQIAIAMEGTRLRQEMQERLNELNKLYAETTHKGWTAFRTAGKLPAGYVFDRTEVHPDDSVWVDDIEQTIRQKNVVPAKAIHSATVAPLAVRGEVIGVLGIYNDPQRKMTEEDLDLIEQVSDQVALALESARLFEQTSIALDEAEKLYTFSRKLAEAQDLNAVVSAVVEAAGIPQVNRAVLITYEYDEGGVLSAGLVKAAWHSGHGHPLEMEIGTRYEQPYVERMLKRFQVQQPMFTQPMFTNETAPESPARGIYSMAALPLWVGALQIGVLLLETDEIHPFSDDDKRPMNSLSQQAAITIQSRLLFEQILSSEAVSRKTSQQLVEALNAAQMANWEFDVATGMFIFNEAYYQFLETSLDEEGSYQMPAPVFAQKYVHPEDAAIVGAQIQKAMLTTDPNYRAEFEARLGRSEGGYRSVVVSLRVEKDRDGNTIRMYGTNQDITERKQAQETIAKRAVELATVAEITTRVSTIQNPDEMLQTAVDLTRQTFSLYHVHIYLLNESGDTLVISKGAGEIGRMMVAEGQKIGLDAEKSLTARAARTRQGVIVNDVRQDPYFLAHPLLSETRSEMAVPMIAGDRLLGVIDVQDTQINRFTPEDVNIMTTLAAQIAVSLQNARSFARAQRQAEREALINAISERIQATNSVENALQVAVREIGRALGAQHTAIRLGLERKTDGEEDAKS
jgi:PAS domain S-box-containing protein